MTTGSSSYNYQSYVPNPDPLGVPLLIGRKGNKTWSGGDSIKPATPRSSYRTGQISPREVRSKMRETGTMPNKLLRLRLPPNPYSMARTAEENGVHALLSKATNQKVYVRSVSIGSYSGYDDPAMYYQTVAKLQDHMFGSGFAPSVFLAEGGQALRMILGAATKLRLAIHALARFNPRGVLTALGISAPHQKWSRKLIRLKQKANGLPEDPVARYALLKQKGTVYKGLSDLWIEVQYGWLPLFQDAEAGAQWLAYALTPQPNQNRFKVSKSWVYSGTAQGGQGFCVWRNCRTKRRLGITVYSVQAKRPLLPSLPSVAGVAWEITPWSFAIDWFVPIGSYLSACSTAADVSGSFVVTQSYEKDYFTPVSLENNYLYLGSVLGNESLHTYSITRTVSSTLPIVSPLNGLLSKDQSYKSWRRAANAVALLTQGLYVKHPGLFS